MIRSAETSILFLLRPIALAASFAFAILLFCCRGDNAFMLYFGLYDAMDELIGCFGAGALVSCIALVAAPTESRRARIVWTVLSGACCIAGFLIALLSGPANATRVAAESGLLLGFGTIGFVAQWACVFAKLPRETIPFTIALSFFFGSVLWFAIRVLGGFVPVCVALVVCAICSGAVLLVTEGSPGERADGAAMPSGTAGGGKAAGRGGNIAIESAADALGAGAGDEGAGAAGADCAEGGAAGSADSERGTVRAAITFLDGFSLNVLNPELPVNRMHALEALGAVFVSMFVLGVMYWPDSREIVQLTAMLRPLAYALACILVLVVSARGHFASLASGGVGRLRRRVLILAAPVLAISVIALPNSPDAVNDLFRFFANFALDIFMLFGIITSFIHLMRHGFSPAAACATIVLFGIVATSLGIAAFVILGLSACYVAAAGAGAFGIALGVIAHMEARGRE